MIKRAAFQAALCLCPFFPVSSARGECYTYPCKINFTFRQRTPSQGKGGSKVSGFNWLDFVLIVLLLIGMAVGYAQGLIRQLIGLGALYVALVLATTFFRWGSQTIAQILKIAPNTLTNAITFFAILLVVMGTVNFLGLDAYKSTKLKLMPFLDHITGMLLGVLSMWIIVSIAVSVLMFSVNTQIWFNAETAQLIVKSGLNTSQLAAVTSTTLPVIVSTIRVWLPNGLPAVFNL